MLAEIKTNGYTIKEILSDNGGEFDNKAVRNSLKANGIRQRLIMPYASRQNSSSECKNRTIVETAHTLRHSKEELPQCLWDEMISSSAYMLNCTGKSSVEGKSPYGLWYGKKLRLDHLWIIVSTCYAHIPKQKRRKWCKKAIKGNLIGYDGDFQEFGKSYN